MRNSVIGFDGDAQESCYGQNVNGGTISGWWRRNVTSQRTQHEM
jgi:hypothetical protein